MRPKATKNQGANKKYQYRNYPKIEGIDWMLPKPDMVNKGIPVPFNNIKYGIKFD